VQLGQVMVEQMIGMRSLGTPDNNCQVADGLVVGCVVRRCIRKPFLVVFSCCCSLCWRLMLNISLKPLKAGLVPCLVK
jgi:hypothetical protein